MNRQPDLLRLFQRVCPFSESFACSKSFALFAILSEPLVFLWYFFFFFDFD
jgi:hypothetical protein